MKKIKCGCQADTCKDGIFVYPCDGSSDYMENGYAAIQARRYMEEGFCLTERFGQKTMYLPIDRVNYDE